VFRPDAPLPTDLDGGKSAIGNHAPDGFVVALEQPGDLFNADRRLQRSGSSGHGEIPSRGMRKPGTSTKGILAPWISLIARLGVALHRFKYRQVVVLDVAFRMITDPVLAARIKLWRPKYPPWQTSATSGFRKPLWALTITQLSS
jgi:hypothetical protein